MLAKFTLAVFMMEDLDDTDINLVSPPDELIVDDILLSNPFFNNWAKTKSENLLSYPHKTLILCRPSESVRITRTGLR